MNAVQPVRAELDSLAHLEERISRAVELVSQLRAQNAELQQELAAAVANRDTAQAELTELRSERKNVRTRIEKLLGQMELLSAT